jgi:hypothetical protein
MWLTRLLAPDFKTIADFRRDNGTGIRNVCAEFVRLCREPKLFSQAIGGHYVLTEVLALVAATRS